MRDLFLSVTPAEWMGLLVLALTTFIAASFAWMVVQAWRERRRRP